MSPDRSKDRDERADARDLRADARDHEADARDVRHTAANVKQREETERYFKVRDRQQEHATETGEPHPQNRRHRTTMDFIILAGAACGASMSVAAVVAALFNYIPYAKAAEMRAVEKRLEAVESNLGSINIGQKQMQELQLQDRVQKAEERLLLLPPGSSDAEQWRTMRNETRQRLEQVQAELRAAIQGAAR